MLLLAFHNNTLNGMNKHASRNYFIYLKHNYYIWVVCVYFLPSFQSQLIAVQRVKHIFVKNNRLVFVSAEHINMYCVETVVV